MTAAQKKGTVQAILILFLSNFLSRIIGFIRVMVFAQQVGTSGGSADAYAFSFLLPEILNHLLAGSALSITFIPIFQRLSSDGKPRAHWNFFSNLFTTGTILFLIFLGVSALYTEEWVRLMAGSSYPEELIPLTVRLTRIILPAQLFFFWGALFNGVQYAQKSFTLPALNPLIYNSGIIAGGVLLHRWIGVEGFSWGVLVGSFVGNVLVGGYGVYRLGGRLIPQVHLRERTLREWFIKTLPLMIGLGFTFSTEFLIRYFGARTARSGEGALAALEYGFRLFMMLVALFGQSVAAGSYPFITALATKHDRCGAEQRVFDILVQVGALLFTATALLMVTGESFVMLLFQRPGSAFTAESTAITAEAFIGYLPGAFFFAGVLILNRLYYAFGKTITPLVLSSVSLLISWPLFHLFNTSFGTGGIAFATALFSLISFGALLCEWKRLHHDAPVGTLLLRLGGVALPALASGTVAYGVTQIPMIVSTHLILRLLVPALTGGGVALAIYSAMGVLNLPALYSAITRRFRRS